MKDTTENGRSSETLPSEFRCPVDDGNKFQLPPLLVREVGFKSTRMDFIQSAKVAWYYHEEDEKAVLANESIDRSSLELVGASALSGVSNENLDSGDVSGARVTVIKDLPDSLYDRLTRDRLVLKPLYEAQHSGLEGTSISVYPGGEYDRGELPNVDHEKLQTDGDDTSSDVVGTCNNHMNSI